MRYALNLGGSVSPSGNLALAVLGATAATAMVGIARDDWTAGAAPESTPHLPGDHHNYADLAAGIGGAVLLVAAGYRARHAMRFLRGPII